MTIREVVDTWTADHFTSWLDHACIEEDQPDMEEKIARLLNADPQLIENHSWPELRMMAETK